MAFRILTSDEIELLTPQQRERYAEELAIYQERVRFVEQLEKQERMILQPYEPKLRPIPATPKAPQQAYTAPEYTVASCDVPVAAAPAAVKVSAQTVKAMLPPAAQVLPVDVEHINVPEAKSASLPSVGRTAAPRMTLGNMEPAAAVSAQQEVLTAPVLKTDHLPEVKCQLPDRTVADIPRVGAVPAVSIDTQALYSTPKAIPHPGKCDFNAPEQAAAQIPQVAVKAGQVKKITVSAEAKAVLPEMPLTGQPVSEFAAPQLNTAAIPQTAKPVIPAKRFTPAAAVRVSLKTAAPTQAPSKTYTAPRTQSKIPSAQAAVKLPRVASAPQKTAVSSVEQPTVGKAPTAVFQCSIPQYTQPEVSSVQAPKVASAPQKPMVTSVEQPTVGKAPTAVFQCSIPQYTQPAVSSVQAPKVTSASLQPSVSTREQPSVSKAPTVAFKGFRCGTPQRPQIKAVCVPDVLSDETVRSLLHPNH